MPPRVKKDAHDIILEFIRSRPPLKPVRIFLKIVLSTSYFFRFFARNHFWEYWIFLTFNIWCICWYLEIGLMIVFFYLHDHPKNIAENRMFQDLLMKYLNVFIGSPLVISIICRVESHSFFISLSLSFLLYS